MTPFAKAEQILTSVIDYALTLDWEDYELPTLQYAQMGEPVVACPLVTVAVTASLPSPAYPVDCGAVQLGTFSIVIARDCASVSNQDGTDNPEALQRVSTEVDQDGTLLWNWANQYQEFGSKEWSISWVITGGLAYTTLILTTGID